MTAGQPAPLDTPVLRLQGIGQTRAAQLSRLRLGTVGDFLAFYPRTYEDWGHLCPIRDLQEGMLCCVRAIVTQVAPAAQLQGGRSLSRVRVADAAGQLTLSFFNRPYIKKQLALGTEYDFYGKVQLQNGRPGMCNPKFLPANRPGAGGLCPVYRQIEGVSQNLLTKCVAQALELARGCCPELLPPEVVRRWQLCSPQQAYEQIHRPATMEQVEQARRRLIFEELFLFCCARRLLRAGGQATAGPQLSPRSPQAFFAQLPYPPTGAQRRAVEEAFSDLCGGGRMNRLVQGDVGSGKTLVAAACAWLVAQNGRQTVIMAPTELLAQQHHQTLRALFQPMGIRVGLLTAGLSAAEKRRVLQGAETGEIQVLCGTHALIQGQVALPRAALFVVDEQHRFGVGQRAALGQKSNGAHLLAMSATPIPRTLTLIIYGDLDVSILDELPPGRHTVLTYAVTEDKRARMYGFIRRQTEAGGQAYIVCPLVEEEAGSGDERKAAGAYLSALTQALPGLRAGLLHGRMKAAEKEAVMKAFSEGRLDVLVSTTVIEVGVNVPNATLMIVENADLFGLSQLHQLRGRVGRGSRQSYCILMHHAKTDTARARLSTLCRTNDGFAIADEDLRLRGPGDFFGRRQHGLPSFTIADLATDVTVLQGAQQSAVEYLSRNPQLRGAPLLAERVHRVMEQTLAVSMN